MDNLSILSTDKCLIQLRCLFIKKKKITKIPNFNENFCLQEMGAEFKFIASVINPMNFDPFVQIKQHQVHAKSLVSRKSSDGTSY